MWSGDVLILSVDMQWSVHARTDHSLTPRRWPCVLWQVDPGCMLLVFAILPLRAFIMHGLSL